MAYLDAQLAPDGPVAHRKGALFQSVDLVRTLERGDGNEPAAASVLVTLGELVSDWDWRSASACLRRLKTGRLYVPPDC